MAEALSEPESQPLIQVRELTTSFYSRDGVARAVDGVSFELRRGETLGLVGESGCGKSATALSMMRLLQAPAGRVDSGQVLLNGRDLLQLSEAEMCRVRGDDMAMIFQEPMTSLNPVLSCGYQIMEAIILHQNVSKQVARERAIEMLELVGISAPAQRIDEYPHQMSGVMRWPDGREYFGGWANGQRHGQGTLLYADGSMYSGEWR
ncbi:MAG TPA: ATP-binding cassette domain-containing protein, partial [Candidatus Latescibacteria bacterium]|nr:ATP-binding cassette domain-containing protein [Candidatus Latescibacterota bacterium]